MKDQNAITDPSAPPARESKRLSVSNCRTKRHRPAPSESRSAISLCRTEARASRRLATFAQAISKTRAKAARTTEATGIRKLRCSGLEKNVAAWIAREVVRPGPEWCWSMRPAITPRSACTSCIVTPGRVRPSKASQLILSFESRSLPASRACCIVRGTQNTLGIGVVAFLLHDSSLGRFTRNRLSTHRPAHGCD
jgi:hypothetical protein